VPKLLAGRDVTGFEERRTALTAKGVPDDLADRVSAMVPGYSAFDIVQVARSAKRPVEEAAEVYFDLSDRLQIGRLRDRITALPRDDRWSTMARGALRDDLYAAHAALAKDVLMVTGSGGTPEQRLLAWARRCGPSAPWPAPAGCPTDHGGSRAGHCGRPGAGPR
jgi:glutamate dehydrogenase